MLNCICKFIVNGKGELHMKKFIALLLSLVMILSSFGVLASAETGSIGDLVDDINFEEALKNFNADGMELPEDYLDENYQYDMEALLQSGALDNLNLFGLTVDFLYNNGANAVHMRSACPPIMYSCKFLNFSRANNEMELIARRIIVELEGEEGLKHIDEYSDSSTERGKSLRQAICEKFNFASLEFQSLEGIVKAIGLDECQLCTYCWNGKE